MQTPQPNTRLAGRARSAWLCERSQWPAACALALTGLAALGVSAILVALHVDVIAQLTGGLALLPLSLAVFLRMLPPSPWTDAGADGWGHERGSDGGGPWPRDEPPVEFDWEKFERQFRAFVAGEAFQPPG